MTGEQIRDSVIAGTWYPGDPGRLRREIENYLQQAEVEKPGGRLVALISPHAGYRYSGRVAAYAYKTLQGGDFDSVVVVAPSHRAAFDGVSVYDRGGYRTPLGVMQLDHDLVEALKASESRIHYVPEAHSQEHSLEIQLPFLQVVLPGARLVPLVMGRQDFAVCNWLASAVANCIRGRKVLVVASSDLSHFHPYETAKRLDEVVLRRVADFDPEGLSSDLAQGRCEACGGGPMVSAMLIARALGANKSKVLFYANSGDVTGDHSSVVGYMAAAFWNNPGKGGAKEAMHSRAGVALGLSPEEKKLLLRLAREVIVAGCRGEKVEAPQVDGAKLNQPCGAFVTLRKQGKLRGCIGQIHASASLVETVAEMAAAAAFNDPRFPPVDASELPEIEVEISVLTPLTPLKNVEDIQVGVHGLYVRQGGRSGLLLPQVATEYGWDRITFLEHTCLKAGLPPEAWKEDDCELYAFRAEVFSE